MKKFTLKILHPEDEALVMSVLEAFQKCGKIELGKPDSEDAGQEVFDENDEEMLNLLEQADREKGVPYEELRKRFGL